MRLLCVALCLSALAACASPQERIADTLTGYGLDRARAECIGARLQAELSTGQLLELARAARAYRANDPDPSRLGIDDLLRVSSQIRDPAIPLTIARASGRCGLVPAGFTALVGAFAI